MLTMEEEELVESLHSCTVIPQCSTVTSRNYFFTTLSVHRHLAKTYSAGHSLISISPRRSSAAPPPASTGQSLRIRDQLRFWGAPPFVYHAGWTTIHWSPPLLLMLPAEETCPTNNQQHTR